LALFHHLEIGAGVRGEYFRVNFSILIFSHSENLHKICHGDKIAKLMCEKIYYPELNLAKKKLDDTWGGTCGYGSTGQLNFFFNLILY
jgi:dUTP pyrophosphatase